MNYHWNENVIFKIHKIFINGCTESCHFDNFHCRQWWKLNKNDNISVINSLGLISCGVLTATGVVSVFCSPFLCPVTMVGVHLWQWGIINTWAWHKEWGIRDLGAHTQGTSPNSTEWIELQITGPVSLMGINLFCPSDAIWTMTQDHRDLGQHWLR